MNTRIQEIRERVEKATPDEWFYTGVPSVPRIRRQEGFEIGTCTGLLIADCYNSAIPDSERVANTEFIAHSRQDIPWLLDYIEKMEKALELSCERIAEDAQVIGFGLENTPYGIRTREPAHYKKQAGIEL